MLFSSTHKQEVMNINTIRVNCIGFETFLTPLTKSNRGPSLNIYLPSYFYAPEPDSAQMINDSVPNWYLIGLAIPLWTTSVFGMF